MPAGQRVHSVSVSGGLAGLVFLLLVVSWSAPALAMTEGNARQGLRLYRQHCRDCHPKGPIDGVAGAQAKTQSQWKRFFRRTRHPQSDAWKSIPFEDMLDIRRYLNDYAVGTNQDKCGSCWER